MKLQQCPSVEVLNDYTLGKLSATDLETVASHLESCGGCTSQIDALDEQSDAFVQGLQRALPDDFEADDSEMRLLLGQAESLLDTSAELATVTNAGQDARRRLDEADLYKMLLPPESEDEVGRLGGYRVLEVLGAGGMGVVFRAEDPDLQRPVALKVMLPSVSSTSDAAKERFLREARASAAIDHDNIVTIHQVGEDRGIPFLAMQLLTGESLAARLQREGALPVSDVMRIGRETALGLQAAHQQGLTHRDIKPDNIWLEEKTGRVKLVDFGLARTADDQSNLTQSGVIVGTPSFLSPEQARGEPVDHRADLFSVGVVLYQLTTGISPFARMNMMATLNAVTLDDPEPPHVLVPSVPAALSNLIMQLLEKNSEQRIASADALIERLDAVERTSDTLHQQPAVVPPPPSSSTHVAPAAHRTWFGGHGKSLAIVAAAAALVILATVIYVNTDRGTIVVKADGFEVTAENEVVTIRDKESGTTYKVRINEPRSLPSGKYLVVQDDRGLQFEAQEFTVKRGHRKLEVALLLESGPVPVIPPPDSELSPPLSPLALTATPTKIAGLQSWSLETRLHRSSVYLLQSSNDGKFVASAGYDGTIRIWRTEDFEPVQVLYVERPREAVRSIAWSQDGHYLAYMMDTQAYILETQGWETVHAIDRPISNEGTSSRSTVQWSDKGLLLAGFCVSNGSMAACVVDVNARRTLRVRTDTGGQLSWWVAGWKKGADELIIGTHDGKQAMLVSWDVHQNRDELIGPFAGKLYSADLSRYVISDMAKKQWIVKSREGDVLLCSIPLPTEQPQNAGLKWSPNGRFLAWRDFAELKQKIIDVDTGKEVPDSDIECYLPTVCWSPDSKTLMVRERVHNQTAAHNEPRLRLVDVQSGEVRRERIVHSTVRLNCGLTSRFDGPHLHLNLVWSPDGNNLLSDVWDLRTWDASTGQFDDLVLERDPNRSVNAWPNVDTIVGTGGSHSNFYTWTFNVRTKLLKKSGIHGVRLATTPDGKQSVFVDNADKKRVRIVDPMSGEVKRELTLAEPLNGGSAVRVSRDGTLATTWAFRDAELKIWDLRDGSVRHTLSVKDIFGEAAYGSTMRCEFSPDNNRAVISLLVDKRMVSLVWDMKSQRVVRKLELATPSSKTDVAWIDNNRFVHSAGHGVFIFDLDGNLLDRWNDEANVYDVISISPDKTRVACTAGTYAGDWDTGRPFFQIRNLTDGRVLSTHCVLPTEYDYDLPFSFGPTGHWHGPKELPDALSYVAVTSDGQRLVLTPAEFEQRFGWKNDPRAINGEGTSARRNDVR